MIYVGIDPGFQGAIAVLTVTETRECTVYDTPILVVGNGKKEKLEFDVPEMNRLLNPILAFNQPILAGIEEVGPRPMEGVVSVFRFGTGYGLWLGLLAAHGIPHVKVHPAKWKRDVFGGKGREKDASIVMAEALFPQHSFRTPRGRLLDGRAEALLIADYVRRMHIQGKL